MSASFLLSSMTKEKENRVMEILLSSIRPFQLLVGKVLGLGGIGLLRYLIPLAILGAVAWTIHRLGREYHLW